ncbi:hypothetical protein [Brachybacterium vulturis]|uniref:hypothetical protein n=1 Tax=Brachybacterium vulturis TaxID=2017484 RepID=UPI003736E99F
MRPWARTAPAAGPHPILSPSGGSTIDTLILLALFVAILVSVIVLIGRMLVRRREERERWEADGRPEPIPRTAEQKEQDRKTAITWGCLLIAVPVALVLLYTVTR